jgi:hypothetical protein
MLQIQKGILIQDAQVSGQRGKAGETLFIAGCVIDD